jgi:hypothetical protein
MHEYKESESRLKPNNEEWIKVKGKHMPKKETEEDSRRHLEEIQRVLEDSKRTAQIEEERR